MMFPEPLYAEDIVVGVIFHKTFAWYVTEKAYWFLDYRKYDSALARSGYTNLPPGNYASRFDIAILNEETADRFLSLIADRRVPANALSQMMLTRKEQDAHDDLLDFAPCLLVNFDQQQFSSQYPEMINFELYIPDGWTGVYRNFVSDVPEEERYWIVNGHSLYEQ